MGRHLHLLAACCLPASLALAGMAAPQPLILINTSPSEPLGLYRRAPGPPERGRLAAFRVPAAGQSYAAAHLPQIGRGGVLKSLVGAAGDEVCADEVLRLNGRVLGPIAPHDRVGRPLPRWRGCKVLQKDEFLAFSSRIPTSFDSRYYGPVGEEDLIGVFEPLWVRS
ncbi:S26 family signal peptidase [Phenylobacterium sp. LjRoot164]|uniref:S26 family signal peptidase n=1 Tax=unclassified Phenylobacterium TaxID=2640670 RepID=UPI003ECF9FF0